VHYPCPRQIFVSVLISFAVSGTAPTLTQGQDVPVSSTQQTQPNQEEKSTQKALRIEETQVAGERERERSYTVENATSATKTDTPIFDLPVSIQVVPREVIEDQQVIRLQDALKNVSGVYQAFNSGISELAYGVRGFDQDTLYEDGFRLPFSPPLETAHLERVEVLKGPASVSITGIIIWLRKRRASVVSERRREEVTALHMQKDGKRVGKEEVIGGLL
jgi:iron complex outermembrane recepter protein